jgi:hypothetical protein
MRLHVLALLPFVPAALGCAGTVSGADSVDAEATATTAAVVSVERTTDPSDGSRAQASARFIRVAAPSSADDALRAIGAALDLPARGACASVASLADGATPTQPAPVVELVDVGAVSLEAAGVELRLLPRQLPDVTDVVSGVVYARGADPALLPAATRYVVHVAGSPSLGAFDLTATAPSDPAEVRIAGENPAGNLVVSGAAVDVTAVPDGSDDLVYVDVRPNGVRCVLDESGHAAVSAVFFDDAGTLVVHRLHREGLRARGVDSGEVRFDFARSVAYARR